MDTSAILLRLPDRFGVLTILRSDGLHVGWPRVVHRRDSRMVVVERDLSEVSAVLTRQFIVGDDELETSRDCSYLSHKAAIHLDGHALRSV